jgi:hypothetical protein
VDWRNVLRAFVEEENVPANELHFNGILARVRSQFATFSEGYKQQSRNDTSEPYMQFVVGSYDPASRTSYTKSCKIHVADDSSISIIEEHFSAALNDDCPFWQFGDWKNAAKNIHEDLQNGISVIRQDTIDFFNTRNIAVQSVTKTRGISICSDYIESAIGRDRSKHYEGGIGGPIDIIFIGDEPEPRRIRWKNP